MATTPKSTPTKRPPTWDHLKSQKVAPSRKVVIPLDDELAAEWQEAEGRRDLADLRLSMNIENPEIKKQVVEEKAAAQAKLDELKSQMEDKVVVFVVRGMGRKKYEKFQSDPKFTPTPEQMKLAKERHGPGAELPWNPDTFPPALLAKCIVSPEMTEEEVYEMWESDDWTQAELLKLLNDAVEVNQNVRDINWGKG